MKELIKITTNSKGEQLVSARELHTYLGLSERFSKWFERMTTYGFEKDVDYTPYQMVHPSNNQKIEDFALLMDTAKELSMLQRTEKGKEARQYFIACEKALNRKYNGIWIEAREEGKKIRKIETDVISDFVDYAISQGGSEKGCKMYYSTFTREVYKTIGIDKGRDSHTITESSRIKVLEQCIANSLNESMKTNSKYKDTYKKAKADFNQVATLLGFNVTPLKLKK